MSAATVEQIMKSMSINQARVLLFHIMVMVQKSIFHNSSLISLQSPVPLNGENRYHKCPFPEPIIIQYFQLQMRCLLTNFEELKILASRLESCCSGRRVKKFNYNDFCDQVLEAADRGNYCICPGFSLNDAQKLDFLEMREEHLNPEHVDEDHLPLNWSVPFINTNHAPPIPSFFSS
ncbi:hypothetical protein BTUL_0313g00050 [Botrytis tulipae]|uniref:Uncharacterized protein n=1 Tax=Botrytis tulipae TaxID=87230 RepID=A0A4Z1E9B0_9HELO|nr:hypothetical protein BTUL_0313g00050 [Botrytis tulipae]